MPILAAPVSIVSKNEIVREGLKRILTDQGFYVDCAAFCIDDLNAENGAAIVIIDASDIDEASAHAPMFGDAGQSRAS